VSSRRSRSAPGSPPHPGDAAARQRASAGRGGGDRPDWSGGTRLGETLRFFLDRWGQRGMARGAVVVVFSDGWERGDPRCWPSRWPAAPVAHRVVWVNPHRGKDGYEPVQQGVLAACRTATTSSPATRWRRTPSCRRWSAVRDVLPELLAWWRAGETVGVGTVVATFQSAPRPPGASMLVGPTDRGRLGVGRLRRGRGLRARPVGRRVRGAGAASATASPTTTPSRSGSPAAGSSTCTSRR
jgi:hypothetical protein